MQKTHLVKDYYPKYTKDFPGVPVIKTLPSNARGVVSVPGWGAGIPHASWPEKKKKKTNIKQKQYCNKFNKDKKKVDCNHGLPSDSTRFSVWLYSMIDMVWFH